MNIYLASAYERNAEMRDIREVLEAAGHKVTSRWIDQHNGENTEAMGASDLNDNPEYGTPFALKDIEDIKAAETVIHFTGGGRGGRHTEWGMAVILGKRLVLVGDREHVFHCLPQIEWYMTKVGVLRYFTEIERG